jgi:hypothetical protein
MDSAFTYCEIVITRESSIYVSNNTNLEEITTLTRDFEEGLPSGTTNIIQYSEDQGNKNLHTKLCIVVL